MARSNNRVRSPSCQKCRELECCCGDEQAFVRTTFFRCFKITEHNAATPLVLPMPRSVRHKPFTASTEAHRTATISTLNISFSGPCTDRLWNGPQSHEVFPTRSHGHSLEESPGAISKVQKSWRTLHHETHSNSPQPGTHKKKNGGGNTMGLFVNELVLTVASIVGRSHA